MVKRDKIKITYVYTWCVCLLGRWHKAVWLGFDGLKVTVNSLLIGFVFLESVERALIFWFRERKGRRLLIFMKFFPLSWPELLRAQFWEKIMKKWRSGPLWAIVKKRTFLGTISLLNQHLMLIWLLKLFSRLITHLVCFNFLQRILFSIFWTTIIIGRRELLRYFIHKRLLIIDVRMYLRTWIIISTLWIALDCILLTTQKTGLKFLLPDSLFKLKCTIFCDFCG